MKFLFIVLLPLLVFAEDECEEKTVADELQLTLASTNCINSKNLLLIKRGKIDPICKTCKQEFIEKTGLTITPKENKDDLNKVLFDEYEKNMTYAMTEVFKLRKLPVISQYDFKKTMNSCSGPKPADLNQCPGLKSLKPKFDELKTKMASEIYNMMTTEKKEKGFFDRSPQNSCGINEEKMIFALNHQVQESLNPNKINEIITSANDDNIGKIFESNFLKINPILAQYENVEDLKSFLRSIKDPKQLTQLREALYSVNQAKLIDDKISNICEDSIQAMKKSLCSGKSTDLEGVKHLAYLDEKFTKIQGDKILTEDQKKLNLEALSYCPTDKVYDQKLSDILKEMSKSMPESSINTPKNTFNGKYFDNNIHINGEFFCEALKKKKCLSKEDLAIPLCQAFKIYSDENNSLFTRLADSASNNVNSMLRSFVGDAKVTDEKIKTALIKEGILPAADGTIVNKEVDPIRSEEFSKRYIAGDTQTLPPKVSLPDSSPSSNQSYAQRNYVKKFDKNETQASTASSSSLPDLSEADADLERIQNEIKRRLALPENKNLKPEEQQKLAQNVAKSFNRTIPENLLPKFTQFQNVAENQVSQAPVSQQSEISSSKAASAAPSTSTKTGQAAISDKRLNSALSGMYGAQAQNEKNEDQKAEDKKTDEDKIAEINLDTTKDLSQLKSLIQKKQNFNITYKSVDFGVMFKRGQMELTPLSTHQDLKKIQSELMNYLQVNEPVSKLKALKSNLEEIN